jgi:broad specificity polyphosphatase/5'/3'-nucleotidase SurE
MRLLVLADEPVDAARVRAALPGEQALDEAEVLVVAPATNRSRIAFWMSDSDEAIAEAREAEQRSVRSLRSEGVRAAGEVGESEPLLALQDALATYQADLVLLLTGDEALERDVSERFGVRVVRAD